MVIEYLDIETRRFLFKILKKWHIFENIGGYPKVHSRAQKPLIINNWKWRWVFFVVIILGQDRLGYIVYWEVLWSAGSINFLQD